MPKPSKEDALRDTMQKWLTYALDKVKKILEVKDLKLVEVYWQKIKQNVNENKYFLDLLLRLNL